LFDAGEGVATTLGKKVFAIRHVFVSHGHEDHIAGISNLVNVRNLAPGDREKPLTIYFPRHDRWVNELLAYIERKQSGLLRYPLYAQPVDAGDQIELADMRRPTRVTAFPMKHIAAELSLGYEIEEERKVMESADPPSSPLGKGGREGGVHRYHPVFLYTGDGYDVQHSPYGRADVAVHEATFLSRDAAKAGAWETARHSTIDGALGWAAREDVKALILCHISDRYTLDEVVAEAAKTKQKSGFRGELYVAFRERIVPVSPGTDGSSSA
jgi:ribonuclease Z